jgi:hypothetical protein
MGEIEINSVMFSDEGMAIQYIEVPEDVRVKGQLVQTHVLQLSAGHPDYREDIQSLHARAVKALRNALQDFSVSEPHVAEPDETSEEEDDDRGMGE